MFQAKHRLSLASVGLALTLGACAGSSESLAPAQSAEGTSRVNILVATTRRRSAADAGEMFGGARAENVSYANYYFNSTGQRPNNWRSPEAYLSSGQSCSRFSDCFGEFSRQTRVSSAISATAKATGRKKVLVFVHGFNNRFDDAVYRFAQIVHDAKAPGIPVLFSWPSRGEVNLRAYTYDRESANYSRDAFAQMLETIAANPNVKEINVLAHSMGNWVALEALRRMAARTGKIGAKIKNVMLVAPMSMLMCLVRK